MAEFRKSNVFNESWKRHWNFSLKTIDFRHSAAAHCYRSRGTLVCRGTQVGKHWSKGWPILRHCCVMCTVLRDGLGAIDVYKMRQSETTMSWNGIELLIRWFTYPRKGIEAIWSKRTNFKGTYMFSSIAITRKFKQSLKLVYTRMIKKRLMHKKWGSKMSAVTGYTNVRDARIKTWMIEMTR